jgi:hypothetical protein
MARLKLKGTKHAEVLAHSFMGEPSVDVYSRILQTPAGDLFADLLIKTIPHAYTAA